MNNLPYLKVRETSSIGELIHEYIVEFFGCLIPGSAFLLGAGFFLRFNAGIISIVIGREHSALVSDISYIADKIHENWIVYLMAAYVIGILFNRRSLQQPDSISQIIRALERTYKTAVAPVSVYFLVCCFGSIKKFIFEFNAHVREICKWCALHCTPSIADQAAGDDKGHDFVYKAFQSHKEMTGLFITEEDRRKVDIVKGNLKISICVLRFISKEIVKYLLFFLFALSLVIGAYVAELVQPDSWPYGVGIAVFVNFSLLCFSPLIRRICYSAKGEVRWRDCPRKDSCSTQCEKEAFNQCSILKSQITRYPYEDIFDVYLPLRDCPWLSKYGWCRTSDRDGKSVEFRKRSNLRMIESMKLRLYQIAGNAAKDIKRIEAQIRLIGTVWYMSKFFLTACWVILFLLINYKICRDAYWVTQPWLAHVGLNANISIFTDHVHLLSYFYRNLFLYLVAFFINYSSASFLHFLRLKEAHHILELFNFHVNILRDEGSNMEETILKENDFYRDFISKKETGICRLIRLFKKK